VVVLIAEDDVVTRHTLVRILEGLGHQVIACGDGDEAWQAFQAKAPPILILDWVMPGKDGLELCRAIRADCLGCAVQILMLTGRGDVTDVDEALAAGADDYLVKPIDVAQLKIRLQVAAHRLQLQTLLSESEERQQRVMNDLPAMVWAINGEGSITYGGGAGLLAMGLTPTDLLGRHFTEAFASCNEISAGNSMALAGHQVTVDDTFQGRALVARITPMWDHHAGVVGAVGVAQDISVQRQLEAQVSHSMKMEILGQLVAGIAHDFNNLLAGIMGNLELVQLDGNTEIQACLQSVMEAAQHGASLTQQLLSFSRKREPGMQEVDPGDVCGQVVRLLRRTLTEGIGIDLEVEPAVPAIWGDPEQLHQVVMNLCVNARDAIAEAQASDPDGGRREGLIRVAVGYVPPGRGEEVAGQRGGYVCMSVTDNGCGMDEAIQARAFEAFFTTKREGRGTGLGLATMQRLVERHHGRVTVQSTVGGGTNFNVYLPVRQEQLERRRNAEDAGDGSQRARGGAVGATR
jgi:two-component system cell cycle sensor histidine kinase/response regulator CckA